MFDKFMYSIAILFMLIGLITVINFVVLKLLTPERKQPCIVIIPLTETNNPARLLSCAIEKRNICGEGQYCEILGVDFGMSEDTRAFVDAMYSGNDKFSLCDYSNMQREINNKLLYACSNPQKADNRGSSYRD